MGDTKEAPGADTPPGGQVVPPIIARHFDIPPEAEADLPKAPEKP